MERDAHLTAVEDRLLRELEVLLEPFGLTSLVPALGGGKLFRASFARLVAGESSARLVTLSAAMELLHTSTLVHDDVIDQSPIRRGIPSIWQQRGVETAILVGNLLAGQALKIISEENANIQQFFATAYTRINVAQLSELQSRWTIARSMDDYFDVVAGKTASMLELAAQVGTVCAHYEFLTGSPLARACQDLGAAFQLLDDVEDLEEWVCAESVSDNDASVTDIMVGNYNYPILRFVELNGLALTLSDFTPDEVAIEWAILREHVGWRDVSTETRARALHHLRASRSMIQSLDEESLRSKSELIRWLGALEEPFKHGSLSTAVKAAVATTERRDAE